MSEIYGQTDESGIAAMEVAQVERVRRRYAYATDLLRQQPNEQAVAKGTTIYHQIFTANANMRVIGRTEQQVSAPLAATGPDGWAAVVMRSLKPYEATQHLLGTQLVTFDSLSLNPSQTQLLAGQAKLTSELQAWHNTADQKLRLVLGRYTDTLSYSPAKGWQIFDMLLEFTATDERPLGRVQSL